MRVSVTVPDFHAILREVEGSVAEAATGAMNETMIEAKEELRTQTRSAGLGDRLAKTWQGRAYPSGSRNSLEPAGYIYSKAPQIADAFARGATIVPVAGQRFLAIPTDAVPMRVRRGGKKPMTPFEVENTFNQDLVFKRGRNGHVLAFVNVVRGNNGRGFRRGTSVRLKGRKGLAGRALELVLMFTLVPVVRLPRLLDVQVVADRWERRFLAAFARRLTE